MKIDELDEFQGLTGDMVTAWLFAHDWQRMPAQDLPRSECWVRKGGSGGTVWIGVDCSAEKTLLKLAAWMECSAQALLREINPRWRKGFPSNAALAEHDEWLIRAPWGAEFVAHISYGGSDDGYMIMIPPDSESGDCGGIEESVWGDCFYWPCDGNANRVRWPVDAEGNML